MGETEISCPECGSSEWQALDAERADYVGLELPAVHCLKCHHEYETRATAS